MPMNRKLYPDDWEAIALRIKTAANWTCEACQRPCRRPGESDNELFLRITELPEWAGQLFDMSGNLKLTRFTLTTAHPNHDPWNPNAELRAWCSVCHCRYDLKAMGTKRRLKLEMNGQLSLLSDPAGHGKDPAKVQRTIFEEVQ